MDLYFINKTEHILGNNIQKEFYKNWIGVKSSTQLIIPLINLPL